MYNYIKYIKCATTLKYILDRYIFTAMERFVIPTYFKSFSLEHLRSFDHYFYILVEDNTRQSRATENKYSNFFLKAISN